LEFMLALIESLATFVVVLGGTARASCHSAGARAFFLGIPSSASLFRCERQFGSSASRSRRII
jgi:hypothetical protein